MTNYDTVKRALAAGADPRMLCITCPWDRHCITPPQTTAEDIEAKMAEAEAADRRQSEEMRTRGEQPGPPVGMLLTALVMGGRDTSAAICPVLATRLRLPEGRQIVDTLKAQMTEVGP